MIPNRVYFVHVLFVVVACRLRGCGGEKIWVRMEYPLMSFDQKSVNVPIVINSREKGAVSKE